MAILLPRFPAVDPERLQPIKPTLPLLPLAKEWLNSKPPIPAPSESPVSFAISINPPPAVVPSNVRALAPKSPRFTVVVTIPTSPVLTSTSKAVPVVSASTSNSATPLASLFRVIPLSTSTIPVLLTIRE